MSVLPPINKKWQFEKKKKNESKTLAKIQPRLFLWMYMRHMYIRFSLLLFSGKLIFNGVLGHSYASIKIAIFKTLRRLAMTWNFARSITRVSTHEHEQWEHCLCRQSLLKRKFFWQLTVADVSSTCCHPGSQNFLSECNVTCTTPKA